MRRAAENEGHVCRCSTHRAQRRVSLGRELVAAGREQGHEWSLVLGVSQHAHGSAPVDDPEWIHEFAAEPSGPAGIIALRRTLLGIRSIVDADIVVSLIPQTDMVLALTSDGWHSFVVCRGPPLARAAP